jgi:hypothetical protein
MDCGVHSETLHSFELRRVRLVEMRQHPPEILDGIDFVDRLDLIEKCIDRMSQLGVNVQRQTVPGDRHREAPPLRELIGLRIRRQVEHRIVQRAVNALPYRTLSMKSPP